MSNLVAWVLVIFIHLLEVDYNFNPFGDILIGVMNAFTALGQCMPGVAAR